MKAIENVRYVDLDSVRSTIREIGKTRVYNRTARKEDHSRQTPEFHEAGVISQTKHALVPSPQTPTNYSSSHPMIASLLKGLSLTAVEVQTPSILQSATIPQPQTY